MYTTRQCKPTSTWRQTTTSTAFLQATSQGKCHHSAKKCVRIAATWIRIGYATWNWDGAYNGRLQRLKSRLKMALNAAWDCACDNTWMAPVTDAWSASNRAWKWCLNGIKTAPSDPQHEVVDWRSGVQCCFDRLKCSSGGVIAETTSPPSQVATPNNAISMLRFVSILAHHSAIPCSHKTLITTLPNGLRNCVAVEGLVREIESMAIPKK